MKNHLHRVYSILLMIVLFACVGCDPDEKKTPQQEVTEILRSGIWRLESANVDGVIKSDYLQDLSLSFSESFFSATNGEPVFPNQDSWEFVDEEGRKIITGEGLEIALTEVTKERVTIMFAWSQTTFGGGRASSLAGEHILAFTK